MLQSWVLIVLATVETGEKVLNFYPPLQEFLKSCPAYKVFFLVQLPCEGFVLKGSFWFLAAAFLLFGVLLSY